MLFPYPAPQVMPATTCHYLQQVFVAAVLLDGPTPASRVSCAITSRYSEFTSETWGLFPKTKVSLSQTTSSPRTAMPTAYTAAGVRDRPGEPGTSHTATDIRRLGAGLGSAEMHPRPPAATHTAAPDRGGWHLPVSNTSIIPGATNASSSGHRAGQAQGICCTENTPELFFYLTLSAAPQV